MLKSFEFSLYENLLLFNNSIGYLISDKSLQDVFLKNIVMNALSIEGTTIKVKNVYFKKEKVSYSVKS